MWCFPFFVNRCVALINKELAIRGMVAQGKNEMRHSVYIRVTFEEALNGVWTANVTLRVEYRANGGFCGLFWGFSGLFFAVVGVLSTNDCGRLIWPLLFCPLANFSTTKLFHIMIIWYICTKFKWLWQRQRLYGFTWYGRRRITSLGAFRLSMMCLQRSRLA